MTSPLPATTPAATTATKSGTQSRRSALAGFFGGALEYYDMYIFGFASALVFNRVFFPDAGATGLLLSLGTYGVAYLARPLGGFLAGHYGDRMGRRRVMLATLLVMGVATFLIGCLPTYGQIGVWAPVMLVALRLLQGLSVGGEASGSTSLTLEHAPEGRRGLFTAWMVNGIWVGYIVATFAFLAVSALPDEQLFSWGWRIPFLGSAIIVVLGLVIRRTLEDPTAFLETKSRGEVARAPISQLLRHQPVDVVRVIFATLLIVISTTVPVYGLSYATNNVGIPASTMMWTAIFGYSIALVTQPLFAVLSDRIGRKPVLIGGNLVGAVAVWEFFWAVSTANVPMIYLGMFLCMSVGFACCNAVYPVFFSEMFNLRYRVSGMAIGLQLGIVVTGFSPSIIQTLSTANHDAWWPAALFTTAACLISAVAVATARETYRVPLELLGSRHA